MPTKAKKEIKPYPGKNNILVIAPHGVKDDDQYTNIIAEELASKFECYAVINEKYRKPTKNRGPANPKKKLLEPRETLQDKKLIAIAAKIPENDVREPDHG